MTTFRYLTPDEWGMTWVRPGVPEKLNDPEAYIHHAGGADWMHDDAVTVFRQLNSYAQQGKGYSAVDYDILVHYSRGTDVVTIGGARCEWMSAATAGRNEEGEAICLCADTEAREPLDVELEGLALAVVYGIDKGWIARDAAVLGHRDNPAHPNGTQCPGKFLYAELPTIRARVAELLTPPPPPTAEDPDMPMFIARNAAGLYAVGDSVKKAVYSKDDVAFPLARAERAGCPLVDEATGLRVTHTAWRLNPDVVSVVTDSQFRTLGTG